MQPSLFFAAIIIGVSAASAESPPSPAPLDTGKIHSTYLDGDFDKAIDYLEKAVKDKRIVTHGDSVFLFKHLGVMYAARNDTREKGKYYMYQLLTVEPTARILDMYASDMIYMIFKNIREEFEANKVKLTRAEQHVNENAAAQPAAPAAVEATTPDAQPIAPATTHTSQANKRRRAYFLAGGAVAALVGVGITAHLLFAEEPSTKLNHYAIDR